MSRRTNTSSSAIMGFDDLVAEVAEVQSGFTWSLYITPLTLHCLITNFLSKDLRYGGLSFWTQCNCQSADNQRSRLKYISVAFDQVATQAADDFCSRKSTSAMFTHHQGNSKDPRCGRGGPPHVANAHSNVYAAADTHTRIYIYLYFNYIRKMGNTLPSAVSLWTTEPKCVVVSLMQLKWKQMQMFGGAAPKRVKQEEVEKHSERERETERRKCSIISAHFIESFACVHCGSLITRIVLVSCHLQINTKLFIPRPRAHRI